MFVYLAWYFHRTRLDAITQVDLQAIQSFLSGKRRTVREYLAFQPNIAEAIRQLEHLVPRIDPHRGITVL